MELNVLDGNKTKKGVQSALLYTFIFTSKESSFLCHYLYKFPPQFMQPAWLIRSLHCFYHFNKSMFCIKLYTKLKYQNNVQCTNFIKQVGTYIFMENNSVIIKSFSKRFKCYYYYKLSFEKKNIQGWNLCRCYRILQTHK